MPMTSLEQAAIAVYIKSLNGGNYPNLKFVKVSTYDKYVIVFYSDNNSETALAVLTSVGGKYVLTPELQSKFVMANGEPIYLGD